MVQKELYTLVLGEAIKHATSPESLAFYITFRLALTAASMQYSTASGIGNGGSQLYSSCHQLMEQIVRLGSAVDCKLIQTFNIQSSIC